MSNIMIEQVHLKHKTWATVVTRLDDDEKKEFRLTLLKNGRFRIHEGHLDANKSSIRSSKSSGRRFVTTSHKDFDSRDAAMEYCAST